MEPKVLQNEFISLMTNKQKLKITTSNYEYVGYIKNVHTDFIEFEITSLGRKINIVTHAIMSFEEST